MQGADYIFCLQDKNYNFYKIAVDGSVVLSSQPYFLNFSPAGWDELAIQNVRNKKYWGIDRSVTIPLAYLEDGAKIIKQVFYTDNAQEDSLYLSIASQQLDYTPGVGYKYWYKQIFRAEVDLTSFVHNSSRVTCTTLEDGLPKYLKSNENTANEYPLNVPEAVTIKMDGINLRQGLNYSNVDGLNIQVGGATNGQLLPCENVSVDGNSTGVQYMSETYEVVGLASNVFTAANTNFLVKNIGAINITFNVTGVLNFFCNQATASVAQVRIFFGIGNAGASVSNIPLTPIINLSVNCTYQFDYNLPITLAPNQYLFMYAISTLTGTSASYQFTQQSKFNVGFISRQNTTYIKGFRLQYLFEKTVANLTESAYQAAISSLLENYKTVVITCGDAIRGKVDAVLKMSFSDLFQFLDSIDSVGLLVNANTINILAKKDMVDVNNIIELPSPNLDTFKVSLAKEYLFNELEIGYPELSNEVGLLNAVEEFNSKFLFSTGTSNAPAKLDKVSKIKTSCYEQERIRITTFQKDSTDDKSDNELFAIHIEDNLQPAIGEIPAHYLIDRSLNASASGIIERDTIYNLFLSPKRNMYRNGPFLRSSLYKGDYKTFFYKVADRNNALICDGVVEKANENVGGLGDKFFTPILFDGEFPVTSNILDMLAANPLQVFQFSINGTTYKGIMIKSAVSGNKTSSQNYQFLSTADNTLTNLINYYG